VKDSTFDPRFQGASDRIESLLDAARRGEVADYLAAFGGSLRARVERQAEERGRAAFAGDLRRTARARKSHAVFAPEPDSEAAGTTRILVESIFTDHVERQTYHLVHGDAGWLVTEVELTRNRIPKNPLGSLATFAEPEGVPVPGVTGKTEASVEERQDN
jgi:hypothetical protein